ncbi:MAG: glycosyltransferase family 2 protein [Myxococcota bacterium]
MLSELLTVVVPSKNEERNIEACLRSVPRELSTFVVDSGSSDRTVEIASSLGATVTDFTWDGTFPKKRNWFLEQGMVITPWVLFLDADERLSERFVSELKSVLPKTRKVGFWIRYSDHFMNRSLKHGIPMRKLSLFRPSAGRYERVDDERWTQLDMEVHEHPVLSGKVGKLRSEIIHLDMNRLEKWISRHNAYSTWEAQRIVSAAVKGNTLRQRLKYGTVRSPIFPLAYFAVQFFGFGGFRDGATGLKFAAAKALYFETLRQKIEELERCD